MAASTQQTVRQIPNSGELGDSSAPSPDGRYVSFTDDSGNVSLRDLETGASRRLTHTADWGLIGNAALPVMSPDGRQVAYVWYIYGENAGEVRLSRPTPGRRLPGSRFEPISEVPYKLAWMPDGQQLQAIRRLPDRTSQIGTVTIENRTFQSIKSLEWRQPDMLSLSPGRPVPGL